MRGGAGRAIVRPGRSWTMRYDGGVVKDVPCDLVRLLASDAVQA